MKKISVIVGVLLGDGSITLCIVGATLAYTRIVPGVVGFGIFALGLLLGVVATLYGIVLLYRSGVSVGSVTAMLGFVPAVFLLYTVIDTRGAPPINDITTDLIYPPAFEAALEEPANADRDMAYPEDFKSIVADSYPTLGPMGMQQGVDEIFGRAMDITEERDDWVVTSTRITPKESVFEGYATTRVFGFVDDFVVRIAEVDGGCVVDMRSKSRDGVGDLGANAARIEAFFAQLSGN